MALGVSTMVVMGETQGEGYVEAVRLGNITIPTTPAGELWLYYRKPAPDLYISARDILGPDFALSGERVAGHIVFIGTSASGLLDIHGTTLGDNVPGVSIHAQAVEQMLAGRYLTRTDWVSGLEIVGFLVLGARPGVRHPAAGAARRAGHRGRLAVRGGGLFVADVLDPGGDGRSQLPAGRAGAGLCLAGVLPVPDHRCRQAADPPRLRLLRGPLAAARDRAQRRAPQAGRRNAAAERDVHRRARLHPALRTAGAAADPGRPQHHVRGAGRPHRRRAGHHRQVRRRRHHGVLERPGRRRRPCPPRLPGGARHAGDAAPAQRRAMPSGSRAPMRGGTRSSSASASPPARRWWATWGSRPASTIRRWATPSTPPRASRAPARRSATTSSWSSRRAPRRPTSPSSRPARSCSRASAGASRSTSSSATPRSPGAPVSSPCATSTSVWCPRSGKAAMPRRWWPSCGLKAAAVDPRLVGFYAMLMARRADFEPDQPAAVAE